ncbi:MAG TPA: response regulator [Bryobacteraceae bacterium]|nr:response regulator [Bryobacteraceae bacterium]
MSHRHAGCARILLIDDNDGDVRLIREAIRAEAPGVQVSCISDSTEALPCLKRAVAAAEGPRLILLDLRMPKKDGFQVLEEIRRDPETAGLPVVILTSSEADQDIARAYALRANAVITKPIGYQRLRAAMRIFCEFWLGVARLPHTTQVRQEHHEHTAD